MSLIKWILLFIYYCYDILHYVHLFIYLQHKRHFTGQCIIYRGHVDVINF